MELRDAGRRKPRSQSRKGVMRTPILWDESFERLRADQLHDLFLSFGVPGGSDKRPTPRSRSLNRQSTILSFHRGLFISPKQMRAIRVGSREPLRG